MGLPEMKPPKMTEGRAALLCVLLGIGMIGFLLWLGNRESNRWQALKDRAEQTEARVNQMKTAAPAYSLIPTAVIQCEEPGEGYCRRYKVYRLTGID